MNFEDLGLAESIVRSVRAQGYETVTPIHPVVVPRSVTSIVRRAPRALPTNRPVATKFRRS